MLITDKNGTANDITPGILASLNGVLYRVRGIKYRTKKKGLISDGMLLINHRWHVATKVLIDFPLKYSLFPLMNFEKGWLNSNRLINGTEYTIEFSKHLVERTNTKAPIESPHFTGIPTVPHPSISDFSNQIATTKWVSSKINEGTHLLEFYLDKSFMYIDEQNVTVTLS